MDAIERELVIRIAQKLDDMSLESFSCTGKRYNDIILTEIDKEMEAYLYRAHIEERCLYFGHLRLLPPDKPPSAHELFILRAYDFADRHILSDSVDSSLLQDIVYRAISDGKFDFAERHLWRIPLTTHSPGRESYFMANYALLVTYNAEAFCARVQTSVENYTESERACILKAAVDSGRLDTIRRLLEHYGREMLVRDEPILLAGNTCLCIPRKSFADFNRFLLSNDLARFSAYSILRTCMYSKKPREELNVFLEFFPRYFFNDVEINHDQTVDANDVTFVAWNTYVEFFTQMLPSSVDRESYRHFIPSMAERIVRECISQRRNLLLLASLIRYTPDDFDWVTDVLKWRDFQFERPRTRRYIDFLRKVRPKTYELYLKLGYPPFHIEDKKDEEKGVNETVH